MLKKVDRILMRVPSIEGAVAYYRDVLGLRLIRSDARIASFKLQDDSTELVVHADPDLPDQATYLLVESVQDMYARREGLRLKFLSPPVAVTRGFRAAARDPFGNVLLLLDRSTELGDDTAAVEDGKTPGMLFAGALQRTSVRAEALIKVYQRIGRTADDLPYTPHFEAIYSAYNDGRGDEAPTRQEVWRHLLNLRKGGKLPKLGPAKSAPPEVSAEDREHLRELLGENIGRRDRLPYTAEFDQLVEQFNKSLARKLSPHLIWRLVATLAK